MKFYDAESRRKAGYGERRLRVDGKPDKRFPAPSEYVGARFPINSTWRIPEDTREQFRVLAFYLRKSRNEVLSDAIERYYYNDIDTKAAKMRSSDDGRYAIKTSFRISLRTQEQMRALAYHLRKSRNEVVKDAIERYYNDVISKEKEG